MKTIEAQEKAREAAEQVRQSLIERMQTFVEEVPQIIEELRRAAAKQLREMEKISGSANEMFLATKRMLQEACERMEKARS